MKHLLLTVIAGCAFCGQAFSDDMPAQNQTPSNSNTTPGQTAQDPNQQKYLLAGCTRSQSGDDMKQKDTKKSQDDEAQKKSA